MLLLSFIKQSAFFQLLASKKNYISHLVRIYQNTQFGDQNINNFLGRHPRSNTPPKRDAAAQLVSSARKNERVSPLLVISSGFEFRSGLSCPRLPLPEWYRLQHHCISPMGYSIWPTSVHVVSCVLHALNCS